MIIATTVRRAGKLAAHLLSTAKNEVARPFGELGVNLVDDTFLALRLCAAPAAANRRVKKELIHVIMSPAPGCDMSVADWQLALRLYEEEFGISPDLPRHVVSHELGDRPPHMHVVYASVDPASGTAIRMSFSRQCPATFGTDPFAS